MTTLQTQQRVKNGLVLVNAAELGSAIIRKIAGNDISTSINGVPASRETLQTLLLQRINQRLKERSSVRPRG